jgi:hypothetical protein
MIAMHVTATTTRVVYPSGAARKGCKVFIGSIGSLEVKEDFYEGLANSPGRNVNKLQSYTAPADVRWGSWDVFNL